MTWVVKKIDEVFSRINKLPPLYVIFSIITLDTFLTFAIIKYVPYTEIDWIAYMQEVQGYLGGERNYSLIRGDTGPLVYPAGFVYIYSLLYNVTESGSNILLGQYIFAGIYIFTLAITLSLYKYGAKAPMWVWIVLSLSKRIHSIFVLRLFNDCIAVLLGLAAIFLFTKQQWRLGCFVYSFAVSIKMNILLYAPGVLLVLLMGTGLVETVICLSICAVLQLILGWPFLSTYPIQYITKSFDLGRVFMYKWTVNYRFLPEEFFVSKMFSLFLLLATILGFSAFGRKWILENSAAINQQRKKALSILGITNPGVSMIIGLGKLSPEFIITTIFSSNFIGVCFARTLHYQFYCWYFHSLPYLLWYANLPNVVRFSVLLAIEVAFNVYPSTIISSLLLQGAHLILLVALYLTPAPLALPIPSPSHTTKEKSK